MKIEGPLSHLPFAAYVGRVNCVTGYGGAARHQIHLLRGAGLRLKIIDTGSDGDPDPERQSALVQEARRSDPGVDRPRLSLLHLAPNCAAPLRRRLPRPHVLVFVWETSRLPREWVSICNSFAQVWCATRWQQEVCVASGVDASRLRYVPFALVPEAYPTTGPILPELERLRGLGYKVFGSMFQWTERKAPRALIGGFLAAFHRGEKVALVLKTYEGDNPATSVQSRVEAIVASYLYPTPGPLVRVFSRRLSHDETLAFYRGLDCYVSAHRGEGFGLPIAEALLLGRPVIATDWSAPAEWASGLYHPVAYTLEAPHSMHPWQPFYTVEQEWAAPDQGSLSAWMREVYAGTAPVLPGAAERMTSLRDEAVRGASAALESLL
jgi:glycosyltransferase involved in cell wall biosynthesis